MSVAYNGTEYLFNALAGFLINLFSTIALLFVNMVTFLIAIFSFSKIKEEEEEPKAVSHESFFNNVFKGFTELFRNKTILTIAIGGGIANFLFGGLNVYQVLIADQQGNAIVLGLMTAAMAIGTLIGSVFLANFSLKYLSLGKNLTLATLLYGAIMLISAYFTNSFLIIVAWGIASIFLGVTHVVQKPFFQLMIPKQHLGKVFSALFSFSVATLPLGSLLFGFLGKQIMTGFTFLFIFGAVYLIIGIIYFFNKKIFNFTGE